MFRKGTAFLIAIAMAAGLTSACGGGPGTGNTDAEPKTAAVTEMPEATPDATREPESKNEPEAGTPEATKEEKEEAESVPLIEFCNDEEVTDWFASIKDDPPVNLEYWVYGEGPYSIEVTDTDLILDAAEALAGVMIGGISEENPDWVSDAGGSGFYFTDDAGETIGFSFMMGCFKWKDSEYHDVADFGGLPEVEERIMKIEFPDYDIAISEDDGFFTRHLEEYTSEWSEEGSVVGGLTIYLGDEGDTPFIQIGRCDGETPEDPEEYLTGFLSEEMLRMLREEGFTVEDSGEVKEYEFGGETLTGTSFIIENEEGERINLLMLLLSAKDSLLSEPHLIRFYANYQDEDEEEVMEALDTAVEEFHLEHMKFEKGDVQPGSLLLDFCNDKGLNTWFEKAEKNIPDELVVTTDSWHAVEDPDMIMAVLQALKTVRIGDVSTEVVGGSGRQIYDFTDHDSGNQMTFMFFTDQFEYDGENYDVADWGDLDELLPKLEN